MRGDVRLKLARRDGTWLALWLLVPLWFFPHFPFLQHANEMPRLFLAEAMLRRGSLAIDPELRAHGYRKAMDLSRSFCISASVARWLRTGGGSARTSCREESFSNKAPGPSVLAVPFLGLSTVWAKVVHHRRPTLAEELWFARLGAALLPTLLVLLFLARGLRALGVSQDVRRLVLAGLGLGSMSLVYSVQFMSHALAAAGTLGAFVLLLGPQRPSPARVWGSGLLASVAVAGDYQSGLVLLPIFAYGLARVRPFHRSLWAAVGALPVLAGLAWYHWRAFGAPLWTGYDFLVDAHDLSLHTRTTLGVVGPRPGPLRESLFGPRDGLLFLAPWLALAVPGLALWLGRGASSSGCGRRLSVLWGLLLVSCGLAAADFAAAGAIAAHAGRAWPRLAGTTVLSWMVRWTPLLAATGLLLADRPPPPRLAVPARSLVVAAALVAPVTAQIFPRGPLLPTLWFLLALWAPGDRPAWLRTALVFQGLLYALWPEAPGLRWTGWLTVALVGLWSPRSNAAPAEALVVLAALQLSLWFLSSITYWHGGWQVGPRYLASSLPLMALATALAVNRWWPGPLRSVVGGLVAVSVAVHVGAIATFPHFPKSFKNPVHDLVGHLLDQGLVAPNVGTLHLGWRGAASATPGFALAGLLLAWAILGTKDRARTGWPGPKGLAETYAPATWTILSFALAAFYLALTLRLPRTDFSRCCHWIEERWPGRKHSSAPQDEVSHGTNALAGNRRSSRGSVHGPGQTGRLKAHGAFQGSQGPGDVPHRKERGTEGHLHRTGGSCPLRVPVSPLARGHERGLGEPAGLHAQARLPAGLQACQPVRRAGNPPRHRSPLHLSHLQDALCQGQDALRNPNPDGSHSAPEASGRPSGPVRVVSSFGAPQWAPTRGLGPLSLSVVKQAMEEAHVQTSLQRRSTGTGSKPAASTAYLP